jgi:hypothetical protein
MNETANEHTITLSLRAATNEQLRRALDEAETHAAEFRKRGDIFHMWDVRAKAIRAALQARRQDSA